MNRTGKILIVDDSEILLAQAASVLTEAGYDVDTTSQSVGASRFLTGRDLVIIDFHMPGFDGKDLVDSMRRSQRGCLFYLYTTDDAAAADYAALGFDGAFREKGKPRSLLAQVDGAFRLIHTRALAARRAETAR